MGNSIVQSLLSVTMLLCGLTLGSVDFCKNHLFENIMRKNLMRFSKENSDREFAVIDGFKSLHCCSHGYRSIEWFKNGVPYPWSTDVSTLIISPESGNQTIYSQVISEMDSGKYWCIVRNDTHSLRHDVFLKVFGSSELEEPPKATYTPGDQWVDLGQNARFYCEAFVGNISLPDAKSEINWRKLNVNSSIPVEGRVKQKIVPREGNQVLGCYLYISDVRLEDYGEYICRVSNTGDQFLELNASLVEEDKTVKISCIGYPAKGIIIIIALLILSATISMVSLVLFRSHFILICSQVCLKSYSKSNEQYDILVAYHVNDSDIALNKIVFTLQNSYHYKCVVHPVTFQKLGCKDIREKSVKSKRLMILLSSAMVENEWTCWKLNAILLNLINIHPRIITVLLQPLPLNDPLEHAGALQDLLKRAYCVEYTESKIQRFWDLLALGLPPFNAAPDNRETVELV